MVVYCLIESYAVYQRTRSLEKIWIPFFLEDNHGIIFLVYCTLMVTTVLCGVVLMSSALDTQETCTEEIHSLVLVKKLGGLKGVSFNFKEMSMMMFPAYTLKSSHDSTIIEFMW